MLVRCRPQLPHEAAALAAGARTPKPFTPRAALPRPRSRDGLEGAGGSGGGSARSSFEAPMRSLTVHDTGALALAAQIVGGRLPVRPAILIVRRCYSYRAPPSCDQGTHARLERRLLVTGSAALSGRLSIADPDRREPIDFAVNHVLGPESSQAAVFDGACWPSVVSPRLPDVFHLPHL